MRVDLPIRAACVTAACVLLLLPAAPTWADGTELIRTGIESADVRLSMVSSPSPVRPGTEPRGGSRDEDNLALGIGFLAIAAAVGTGMALSRGRRDDG